jgi:hypothetical protein
MARMGFDPTGWRKRAAIIAAMFAIALNILVPQGFMTGGGSAAAGLVLCTGSGPVRIASDLFGKPSKAPAAPASQDAGPCAFAGHAAPPPLTLAPTLVSQAAVWSPLSLTWPATRAANPSLAAPPPEAIGPPRQDA